MVIAANLTPLAQDILAFAQGSGGRTPSALASTGSPFIVLLSIGLALVALFAIRNVVSHRGKARAAMRLACARGQSISDLLRTVRMAESLAGVGVWQYDYATGRQEWSEGLKRLFGIDREAPLLDGDAENLLYASDVDLVARVRDQNQAFGTFSLEFTIRGFDGVERAIFLQACNLRGRDGAVIRVVAVLRDAADCRWQIAPTPSAQKALVKQEGTDLLTGLPNQRHVMRELDKLVIQARKTQAPLVLVMFEVDHFPRIALRHGSEAGERLLQKVARILTEQVRGDDPVGRVSDRCFAWVMRGAVDGQARVMTERLRQGIAKQSGDGLVPAATISLGFASMHDGDSALTMFGRADRALQEARESGCNRVRAAA